ncbi:MAG: glycosyltransferase [Spirochaetia bacterium]|nr:glycosyltransferase [Spirochaetia bacterium]
MPNIKAKAPAGPVGRIKRFALIVGTIEPRKNQNTLVEAQIEAHGSRPSVMPLVIVGRRGWGDETLYRRLSTGELERSGIYYIEEADDAVLRWCYEHCSYMICPSLHEGFGLPILEAYLFKKATLLSDIRVFREVGAGSTFVSPLDKAAWKTALLLHDTGAKKKALAAPRFDKKFWSYKRTAAEISAIIDNVRKTNRSAQ